MNDLVSGIHNFPGIGKLHGGASAKYSVHSSPITARFLSSAFFVFRSFQEVKNPDLASKKISI
jgi:hypothetical protein